jgi:hypothetical protein
MRVLAFICVLSGLARADSSAPAGIAGPHRLVGPFHSLGRYCSARECEHYDTIGAPLPVGPFRDWRVLAFPREGVVRVALRTRRGWFVDEQSVVGPERAIYPYSPWLESDRAGARFVVTFAGAPWRDGGLGMGDRRGCCYSRAVACMLGEDGVPACFAAASIATKPGMAGTILWEWCDLLQSVPVER